jgi:hypothetical protein
MSRDQPWQDLEVGEGLIAPSGKLRIVRHVSRSQKYVRVTFLIQHCSWTGRAVTVYSTRELKSLGYRRLGKKFALRTRFDKLLAPDIECVNREWCNFTCCDVKGIP